MRFVSFSLFLVIFYVERTNNYQDVPAPDAGTELGAMSSL